MAANPNIKEAVPWTGSVPAPNPNPPGPGTAKGTWVGTLLMQALQGAYAVPPVNAPSETSQDLGQNFR